MFIYLITNTISGKQYVGQTTRDAAWRWKQHVHSAACGSSYRIHHAIRKYGDVAFRIDILESKCETKQQLDVVEVFWIAELQTDKKGYNISPGGNGTSEETRLKLSEAHKGQTAGKLGRVWTKESRDKVSASVSAAQRGTNNHMFGKQHSEATLAKMRIAHSNISEETRSKMSAARLGKTLGPLSPEHKEKLRQAALGKVISQEQREKTRQKLLGRKVPSDIVEKSAAAHRGLRYGKAALCQ